MRLLKYAFPLALACLLPTSALAQAMSVFGGNEKAAECFLNAEIAGQQDFVGGLTEPCDYALEYVAMSLGDRAATYANRGIILTNGDDFNAAMNDFEKAISIRPETPEIYVNRGNVFFHSRDFGLAISDYTTAVDLNIREIHIAHLDRGMAYERYGDPMMAEEDYRQALVYKPQWQLAEDLLAELLAKQQAAAAEQ